MTHLTGNMLRNRMFLSCAVLVLAVASLPQAMAATGHATAIYNNRGEWDNKIIFGRHVECTLGDEDATLEEATECAVEWAEDWCAQNGDPTCRVVEGTPAEAQARGEITQSDGSTNYRDSRKD